MRTGCVSFPMAVIRFKVSDEMKRRMDSFPHVDWSEVAEEAILRRLEAEGVDTAGARSKKESKDIEGTVSRGGDAVESKRQAQRGQ